MKKFLDLIGETVEIEWKRDPASVVFVGAWSKFRVRSIDDGWIRLQQMPDIPGVEPDPHPFWTRLDSIDTISEIEARDE